MEYKRISNQASTGDMVRDINGNMYLVIEVEFAIIDGEVKKNEAPYVIVDIESGLWESHYKDLYELNQDVSLEARADDMTVYY